MKRLFVAAIGAACLAANAQAQDAPVVTPAQENVIYGMISGTALLMDVYAPEESNGLGVIMVPGSGWYRPEIYSAPPLHKIGGNEYLTGITAALNDEGFTVFVISHRSSPGNRFPAAVNDTRRAVRYVRAMSETYGIDPDNIATLGHSSGANLATMAGLMDDAPGDGLDPIDQTSAAVQAVVGIATPFHLAGDPEETSGYGIQTVVMYTGRPYFGPDNHYQATPPAVIAASPSTYVDSNDPPIYIIDSTDDTVVPSDQSDYMITVLNQAGAPYEHVRVDEGGHDPAFDMAAMAAWLEETLSE